MQNRLRIGKEHRSVNYYNLFKKQRSLCKKLADTCYKNYISKIQDNILADPKAFWSFVQKKKGGTRIPGLMKYDEANLSSPDEIVNAFREFFESAHTNSDNQRDASTLCDKAPQLFISIESVTEEDIYIALRKSKNSLTTGPDGVPSFLLRDCACVFISPLLKLFNLILQQSNMPHLWKQSCICPVFKSGNIADIKNYRPISLLCNFAKTFETVLYKYIYSSVSPYISPYQHGFVQKRSTVSNLGCFTQYTSEIIDNKGQVDTIYMDISKAFDQIDHILLISKLKAYGFSVQMVLFFQAYLSKRELRVRYRNFYSKPFYPTSGVPQGSNLGPLLFLIYINDMVDEISCKKLLFADDLKLFYEIKNEEDCVILQNNINYISDMCAKNRLTLNKDKCYVVTYTKKHNQLTFPYEVSGKCLARKDSIRDLGVIFDSKFTFVEHIYDIIEKAIKMYGFVYRSCRDFTNIKALNNLYYTLIRSRLEYGSIIWYPLYDSHIINIESVQRKYLKFLSYCLDGHYPERGSDHRNLLQRFGFRTLEVRRKVALVKFLYKLLHNKIDCPELLHYINFLVPRCNARKSLTFYSSHVRTNVLLKSPIMLMTGVCNSVSQDCDVYADSFTRILKVIYKKFCP